jgi:gliding motility-associated-like protein
MAISSKSQPNLLRNHSFEAGSPQPSTVGELGSRCYFWDTYESLIPDQSPGTSDWFKATPNSFQGTISCRLLGANSLNSWPFVPINDGNHYAGFVKYNDYREGEGIQQQLRNKLETGYYNLDFDYLLPCDTQTYALEIYLGTSINRCSYLAASISLPATNIGVWQNFSTQIMVPNSFHNQLDWFIILNNGQPAYPVVGSYAAYTYLDDIHFRKSPCTTCDPNGLISWNDDNIRPYMTPNGDNVFDDWCMTNINNVSWYELDVYSRMSPVYHETGQNANGFENFSLCWDGRNNNGQPLPTGDTYQVVVRLGNCGTQITRHFGVYASNDLAHDAFSVSQNYVPPLFGLQPSPTHYESLHLYGGPYYGTHDWYACDSIIIGSDEAVRVPYFWAASTSNLGFHFTNGFDTRPNNDFRIDPGADVDILSEPVTCCPQFRLANPDLPTTQSGSLEELSEENSWLDPEINETSSWIAQENQHDAFQIAVYPNPADDVIHLDIHLANEDILKATLLNAAGIELLRFLDGKAFTAGDHAFSVSSHSLPDGLYFVQVQHKAGTMTTKVVIQH